MRMEESVTLEAWGNLHRVYTGMRQLLDAELTANAGCSLFEHDLLTRLYCADGQRQKMHTLADQMDVTRGGLTRIIDRLVRHGWVRRDQLDENRREVYAVITDEGERVLERARATYVRLLDDTFAGQLGSDELAELVSSTDKLIAALGRTC